MELLCRMRDLCRDVQNFEIEFSSQFGVCLNEGMLLCTIANNPLTAGEISAKMMLTSSNTSKVLANLENKGLIERSIDTKDKRRMYFVLTDQGVAKLTEINCREIEVSDSLARYFDS